MSKRIFPKTAHGVKGEKPGESIFSKNHFAGLSAYPADIQEQLASWGMTRVAGNIWEAPASRDYWKVSGGKIVKLVGSEVNDGEKISAAPESHPASYISAMLDDLDF